jgi:TIR domain
MPTVFLSYSHKDRRFVRKLTRDLERLGVQIWLDEKRLVAGDSLLNGIRSGIDKSDHFVVVLSAASVSSEWVRREIDVASSIELSTGTKKVIPALRDSVTLPAMLEGKVYADFRGRGRYQAGLAALRRALRLDQENVAVMVGVLIGGRTPSIFQTRAWMSSAIGSVHGIERTPRGPRRIAQRFGDYSGGLTRRST